MSNEQRYEIAAKEYSDDAFRSVERVQSNSRRTAPSRGRRGKAPQSVNGIHRRRRRKMSW